ncbi:hypothetical protein ZEAMMB73_Zm00001d047822 [Zea mays]|uniref:Uncharacterized protein n=1 Tax=Zea mays TaxID=4577 RepID=A0A1D6PDR1_MAIZE|nr:hypothetical protein ZEAMMB73_Zm00001d047822 [Zea mays]
MFHALIQILALKITCCRMKAIEHAEQQTHGTTCEDLYQTMSSCGRDLVLLQGWDKKKRRGESSTSLTITSNGRQIGIEGGRERGTAGEEYSLEKASPFFMVTRWQANHANEYRLGKLSGEGVY